jgi:DNA polymerase I-like protein with 3'-5' exonuclease and polymerase domains
MVWNTALPDAEWYGVDDPGLPDLIQEITNHVRTLAIDTETTGLNITRDMPLFWSLAWGNRRICMPAATMHKFAHVFKDPNRRWILANAKYDQHIMANAGYALAGELVDIQVMHALLFEEEPHALKHMAKAILGWGWNDFSDTFRFNVSGKLSEDSPIELVEKGGAFRTVQGAILWCAKHDLQTLIEYAANDAYGTWMLYLELKQQLEEANILSLYPDTYKTLADYFFKVEMPFTRVLWKCERNGMCIDTDYLTSIEGPVVKDIHRLEREVIQGVGRPINLNSTRDLIKLFIEERGYTTFKKTKSGGVCMDESVLEMIADTHRDKEAQNIIAHRALSKLLGTYVQGLPSHLEADGRIHARFNQDVARTGRLSSRDPNVQNIPNPERDKYKVRGAFIAGRTFSELLVFDYKTLEMVLLACAAQEEGMLQNIRDGKDTHMGNAVLVFGKEDGFTYEEMEQAKKIDGAVKNRELPVSALTDKMKSLMKRRSEVKTIGFGLVYGMQANALGRRLNRSKQEAEVLLKAFMDNTPAVNKFFKEVVAATRKTGYAFTILGRRRYFQHINSDNSMRRWGDERKAINLEIQGCLPSSTRVLTKKGYLPIGDIDDQGDVWTGTRWKQYRKLNRGTWRLAELHLENGQVLRCDTRHKVLMAERTGYAFKTFSELQEGDPLCMSMANPMAFGSRKGTNAKAYWMGFCLGNGCTSNGDHTNAMVVAFGDRSGRYTRADKSSEFVRYIYEEYGISTQTPRIDTEGKKRITVTAENIGIRNDMVHLGYPWKKTAHAKYVPTYIWKSTLSERRNFLLGLLDSDGCAYPQVNLHMCNEHLLREVQLLFRTIGVESRLRGPYTSEGFTSWVLNVHTAQVAEALHYRTQKSFVRVPGMLVPDSILKWTTKLHPTTASHATIRSKILRGGSTGPYTIRHMAELAGADQIPVMYATQKLIKKVELGEEETTYTLSVDSPLHRFDSEGVISKNSAADVVKMAMIRIDSELDLWEDYGCTMNLQVHDELVFECDKSMTDEARVAIQERMEHPFQTDLAAPLKTTYGVGRAWSDTH